MKFAIFDNSLRLKMCRSYYCFVLLQPPLKFLIRSPKKVEKADKLSKNIKSKIEFRPFSLFGQKTQDSNYGHMGI